MYFESWADFWAMGKHGLYVWSCYGIAAVVMIYNIWVPLAQQKRFKQRYLRQLRREAQQQ
ncbi:heme exporter protein CcmD [Zooshikella marina]|uniref:Heme exporter protein D n=1 Tax=Zooshikella ganghwensis TaxID=202772 RepID=A0A4V1INE4_9GAMM|nr:heme exporter protein CcmD [Zooshikella ganghwensis]MBU2707091.1 heme exporter protein CcmD [Zooshikella ganghwensis]RDH43441.1 heme exporter protein CcmD [Zooshikella ganghwensis]